MEVALYFPYIRVPANDWFTRVILYWDAAASIVPRRLQHRDVEFGEYMSQLIKSNLVRTVAPDRAQIANDHTFDDDFLAILDADKIPKASRQPGRLVRIHQEKASRQLFDELQRRGLAIMADYQWWNMEERTAGLYMAYLVGSICRVEPDLFPVSDECETLVKLAQPSDGTRPRLRSLLSVTISKALPVPSRSIPVEELARFKLDREEQLRRLQIHLNAVLAELVLITDDTVREARIAGVQQEIKDDVSRLSEQMAKRNWPVALGAVAALASPALGIGTAIVTGGTALALGLGISTGVAGIGGVLGGLQHPPRFDNHSPLAYAALAGALRPAHVSGRRFLR